VKVSVTHMANRIGGHRGILAFAGCFSDVGLAINRPGTCQRSDKEQRRTGYPGRIGTTVNGTMGHIDLGNSYRSYSAGVLFTSVYQLKAKPGTFRPPLAERNVAFEFRVRVADLYRRASHPIA
jgi:hypothetical protein